MLSQAARRVSSGQELALAAVVMKPVPKALVRTSLSPGLAVAFVQIFFG